MEDGIQYIVDNDFNEETRVGLDTPLFDPLPVPWVLSTLEEQTVCSGLGKYTPGWEGLLSGYAPIFDRDGNVTAIFISGIVYFVYLYRHAEIERKANATKSWFLSRMSHEIRTPLNAVICLSEIELRGFQFGSLPETIRENIARIYQSGSSLLGIINDILDISKIETRCFEVAPSVYDTAQMLNDMVNLNKVRIGEKPITLKLEINNYFPAKLKGDELQVRQILNNLLSNAIKYT